jgi:alanine dehydrogenase
LVSLIDGAAVRRVLSMDECIDAMESCLLEQANGAVVSPPRTTLSLGIGSSRYNPKQPGFMRLMPGSLPGAGYIGVKVYVDTSPDFSDKTVLLLYSGRGELLAIINADLLSDIRTGAMGGVAAKHLSREGSSTLGLFGSGRQARTQLEAVAKVRSIQHVKVISRNPDNAKRFVDEMSGRVRSDFQVCRDPEDVVRGSDIVVTATTASEPLFKGGTVEKGTHVTAVGTSFASAREVDTALVKRSKIVVISKEMALRENGEFAIPIAEKQLSPSQVDTELCEVVSGVKEGRSDDQQVTFFKFNGLAIWDVAVGSLVYGRATALGLDKKVEL